LVGRVVALSPYDVGHNYPLEGLGAADHIADDEEWRNDVDAIVVGRLEGFVFQFEKHRFVDAVEHVYYEGSLHKEDELQRNHAVGLHPR